MVQAFVREADIGIYKNNTDGIIKISEGVTFHGNFKEYGIFQTSSNDGYLTTSNNYMEIVVDLKDRRENFNSFSIHCDKILKIENIKAYISNDGKSFREIEMLDTYAFYESKSSKVFAFKDNIFIESRFVKLEINEISNLYSFKPLVLAFEKVLYELDGNRYDLILSSRNLNHNAGLSYQSYTNDLEISYYPKHYVTEKEESEDIFDDYTNEKIEVIRTSLREGKGRYINTYNNLVSLNNRNFQVKNHSLVYKFKKPILLNRIETTYDGNISRTFTIKNLYVKEVGKPYYQHRNILSKSSSGNLKNTNFSFEKNLKVEEIVLEFYNDGQNNSTHTNRIGITPKISGVGSIMTHLLEKNISTYEDIIEEFKFNKNYNPILNLNSYFGGYSKTYDIIKDGINYKENHYMIEVDVKKDVYYARVLEEGKENRSKMKFVYVFDGYVYFNSNNKLIKGEKYEDAPIDYLESKITPYKSFDEYHYNYYENFLNSTEVKIILFYEKSSSIILEDDFSERQFVVVFNTLNSKNSNTMMKHLLTKNAYEKKDFFKDEPFKVIKISTLKEFRRNLNVDTLKTFLDDLERDEFELYTNQTNKEKISIPTELEVIGVSKSFKDKAFVAEDYIDYNIKESGDDIE